MTTVSLKQLEQKTFRFNLKETKEVYWAYLSEGIYLGYRKGPRKCAWVGRVKKKDEKKYYKVTFGETDCSRVNDNYFYMSYEEAIKALNEWSSKKRIARQYIRKTTCKET
jgi:hypothetical protein